MAERRKALGRGIDALIPQKPTEKGAVVPGVGGEPRSCGLEEILPNRLQPRRVFREETLAELARSIEAQGILEPLLVRPLPEDARDAGTAGVVWELIVGERRWRAAQQAGLKRVPIVVRRMTDQEVLEAALVENLLRDDLTSVEEADGYQRLLETTGMTQDELAKRLGRDRSHVANTVRLLKLPRRITDDLARGALTAGHGRALLSVSDPEAQADLHRAILAKHLSVRQAEAAAQQVRKTPSGASRPTPQKDPHFTDLERELSQDLGARVTITPKPGRGGGQAGRVAIACSSAGVLDRVIARLRGEPGD